MKCDTIVNILIPSVGIKQTSQGRGKGRGRIRESEERSVVVEGMIEYEGWVQRGNPFIADKYWYIGFRHLTTTFIPSHSNHIDVP